MDWWGIVFNWMAKVPVIHGFDHDRLCVNEDGCWRSYSRCGRLVSEWNPDQSRMREPGTWIPFRHCLKFGRLCKICFKDEA